MMEYVIRKDAFAHRVMMVTFAKKKYVSGFNLIFIRFISSLRIRILKNIILRK